MDDFDNTTVMVIITPGETTATVPITIIDDDLLEPVEFFNVNFLIGGTDTTGVVLGKPDLAQVFISSEDGML